ncbi:MAG: FG-GAP-like repeat-containing protein [bacterium]
MGSDPIGITAADLDGDNDIDIATANVFSDNVSVVLNDGAGVFGAHTDFPVTNGPWAVFAADFDGDGDIDLATGDYEGSNVSILKNDGDADFSAPVIFTFSEMVLVSDIYGADFDGDDDIDLAVIGLGSTDAYAIINNGNGVFSEGNSTTHEGLGSDVIAADFDGDGDLDLAIASESGPSVAVSINNSALATEELELGVLPSELELRQNYPNPFNPTTVIEFNLERSATAELEIINTIGQVVRSFDLGRRGAGVHQVEWDGLDDGGNRLATGVYFYRLSADNLVQSKKMLLLK